MVQFVFWLLEFEGVMKFSHLICGSDLASFLNLGNGLSTLAAPQSDHPTSVSRPHRIELFSMTETSYGLKFCKPWIPDTDKDAFLPWSWSLATTNEIEDPKLHIASTFRLSSLFVSLIRTTGSPPWVMLTATAVVASDTFFVLSLFVKSLWRSLLCRLQHLGTIHVLLLRSIKKITVLKQLNHSRYFWLCSRRSFIFIDLNIFHKSKEGLVRPWKDIWGCWVYLSLERLKQRYSSSVYPGFETNFCQTNSLSVLTSSPELLFWRQATLWKQSGCLLANLILSVAERVFSLLNLVLRLILGRTFIQVELQYSSQL